MYDCMAACDGLARQQVGKRGYGNQRHACVEIPKCFLYDLILEWICRAIDRIGRRKSDGVTKPLHQINPCGFCTIEFVYRRRNAQISGSDQLVQRMS